MTRNSLTNIAFILLFTLPAFGQSKNPKLCAYIREKMKARNIPGLSLAVLREGEIIYSKGFGMANLELTVPATEKTVCHIASITKTFMAISTMMLVEEGKISLEEPISKNLNRCGWKDCLRRKSIKILKLAI